MRHHLLTLTALCLLLAACGKEAQYSTWTVNGEGFSTNETATTEALRQGISGLGGGTAENRFGLNFYVGELPENGRYLIVQNPEHYYGEVKIGIYFHNQYYHPSLSEHKYLEASFINKKVSYYLPPTWFVGSSDSVLVEGTFKEP